MPVLNKSYQNVPTPPPTDRQYHQTIVESAIQTDDSFDVETEQIVDQLACSAITKALESLQKDDEIEVLRGQATKTKNLLEELRNSTKYTIEEKDKMIYMLQREDELRQCQCLATQICRGVSDRTLLQIVMSSMAHWNEAPSLNDPQTKSIGVDTRMLRKRTLIDGEIESDFYPWIFSKADRICRRTKKRQDVVLRKKLLKRLETEIC